MLKKEIAHTLEQIATFLEFKREDPFRVRAFQNASRAVGSFAGDIEDATDSKRLMEIPGIGPATFAIISEVIKNGQSSLLNELRTTVPAGLVEMKRLTFFRLYT